MPNLNLAVFVCILVVVTLSLPMTAAHPQERLVYYSDYFSFVGRDETGWVAFALDTNRGQDGGAFHAEHFAALHDEKDGWQKIHGRGSFPNRAGILEHIPDSDHFLFRGVPTKGLVIKSPSNGLTLKIQPIRLFIDRKHLNNRYRMGSSSATLRWRGRTIQGRIIYEFLLRDNWNRLTRTYIGHWKNFHGFYLMTMDPVTGKRGDFYLHSHQNEKKEALQGLVDGFAVLRGRVLRLRGTKVRVKKRHLAFGFYRWPQSWSGHGKDESDGAEIQFDLELTDRKTFSNWVIGGFAMGIVKGTISCEGTAFAAYGFGEIIK